VILTYIVSFTKYYISVFAGFYTQLLSNKIYFNGIEFFFSLMQSLFAKELDTGFPRSLHGLRP
jgi:hypothetical protein